MAAMATKSWSSYMEELEHPEASLSYNLDSENDANSYTKNHHSNSRPVRLPPEIISLIVEQLHDYYEGDLASLSLVSRTWCQAAQARLFARIFIFSSRRCAKWNRKFKESPHLARYVKEVKFSDHVHPGCLRGPQAETLASFLTNVQCLYIDFFRKWGTKEQEVVKLFQSVKYLDLKEISTLSIDKDLPDLVFSLPHLERLELENIGMHHAQRSSDTQRGTLDVKKLKQIGLFEENVSNTMFNWLAGPRFDHSELQVLRLGERTGTFDAASFDRFIHRVAPYAKHLSFRFHEWRSRTGFVSHLVSANTLSQFDSLTSITFTSSKDQDTLPAVLRNALALLRTLESPRRACITAITLSAGIKAYQMTCIENIRAMTEWLELDGLVSGSGAFPSLRLLELDIHLQVLPTSRRSDKPEPRQPTDEDVFSLVEDVLPQVYSRGLLNTWVSVD